MKTITKAIAKKTLTPAEKQVRRIERMMEEDYASAYTGKYVHITEVGICDVKISAEEFLTKTKAIITNGMHLIIAHDPKCVLPEKLASMDQCVFIVKPRKGIYSHDMSQCGGLNDMLLEIAVRLRVEDKGVRWHFTKTYNEVKSA